MPSKQSTVPNYLGMTKALTSGLSRPGDVGADELPVCKKSAHRLSKQLTHPYVQAAHCSTPARIHIGHHDVPLGCQGEMFPLRPLLH